MSGTARSVAHIALVVPDRSKACELFVVEQLAPAPK